MSRARTNADQAHTESLSVVPHIIPDVLYPAVANIMVDGTTALSAVTTGPNSSTVASSKYGTVQSDGRMYYYTDIKGSKPIKDPRIGSHFGSQRHQFSSLQLLEQETATHGLDVYSADGREWVRLVDGGSGTDGRWRVSNNLHGVYLNGDGGTNYGGMFFEVTGYFNDINFLLHTDNNNNTDIDIFVNGTKTIDGSTSLGADTSTGSPLGSRYVSKSSLINVGSASLGTTPVINTLKYYINSQANKTVYLTGIELIAQDTTSTATKSQIQIPSQNVVSYGKKFTVSGTPHYDPFNGFTNGTAISSYIDEATSLGMSKWKLSSTWYKPFNGGRVVKWVDSSGVIKTSVTMMPPNAKSIANSASPTNAFATRTTASHYGTNNSMNSFEAGTDLDVDRLSEVAKTFHWREFGNGNANAGAVTGSTGGSYKDFSMLTGAVNTDLAYVMDDGLTSMSGNGKEATSTWYRKNADSFVYLTFIGTGITVQNDLGRTCYAQNLPYGTHILKKDSNSTTANSDIIIDGVTVKKAHANDYNQIEEVTFHQPKRPPIPEDAVVISDYMLMADYVANATAGLSNISKGVRRVGASRDVFYDQASGSWLTVNVTVPHAFHSPFTESSASAIAKSFKLPFFGNGLDRPFTGHSNKTATITPQFSIAGAAFANANAVSPSLTITSSSNSGTDAYNSSTNVLSQNVGSNDSAQFVSYGNNLTLGVNEYKESSSASGYLNNSCLDIASPIHTSSHYQTFESPYLMELVGGDRNMEQNNLVVTPDGKTWDEVTRDVGYLGNGVLSGNVDGSDQSGAVVLDEWRGIHAGSSSRVGYNKDWAIAYDRVICLVDGMYEVTLKTLMLNNHQQVRVNATSGTPYLIHNHNAASSYATISGSAIHEFKRGDYLAISVMKGSSNYNAFEIKRV